MKTQLSKQPKRLTRASSVVSVDDAREIIAELVRAAETEQAGIINALGRTLAVDIENETAVPGFDTAEQDGYAVIAADTLGATSKDPRALSILAESATPRAKQLCNGTAMRVCAGDPLPVGADAVIDTADTYRPDGGPQVLVLSETSRGHSVIPEGAAIAAGEIMIRSGAMIGPAEMGLLASLGMPGVPVIRRPRVAVITTGTAVVDILEELPDGKTRNSTRYELVGMVLRSGCELGRLVHVRDGRAGLRKALLECSACDAVIVAMGTNEKHDCAVQALADTGKVFFERVQIEPGAAAAFGAVDDTPVFVGPGKSILEVFEAIIRPGLMKLIGRSILERPRLAATLAATQKPDPAYSHYIRAITSMEDGVRVAHPLTARAAGIRPWTRPNSLIVIPQNAVVVKRGESVETIALTPEV